MADWSRVSEAFMRACDLPADAWRGMLRDEYDADVLDEVAELRGHGEASADLFDPPAEDRVEVHLPTLPQEAPLPDLTGRLVSERYRIGPLLGEGGSAVVYEAHDELADARVAIKFVRGTRRNDALRGETSALRLLRLPGVVRLLEDGVEGDLEFLVMEYIDGSPFPGLRPGIRHPWAQMQRPAVALLETLGRMHWHGVVHRDLKPANVLVDAMGRAVVLDLGIADDAQSDAVTRQRHALAGTPEYVSPEQLRGAPATPRSDLYAVGVMLYEALSGTNPHASWTVREIVGQMPQRAPPRLQSLSPHVPEAIAHLVERLCAPDPRDRPASAAEALRMIPETRGTSTAQDRFRQQTEAISESELKSLFHGPERLFRYPSDAAQELWRRTEGMPAEVAAEIDAWERAGLARWEGPRLVILRDALERLRAGLRVRIGGPAPDVTVDETNQRLLFCIAQMEDFATRARCAQAVAIDDVDARIDALLDARAIREASNGVLRCAAAGVPAAEWSAGERTKLHAAIAESLPESYLRLYQWSVSGNLERMVQESGSTSDRLHAAGEVSIATAVLDEALQALRTMDAPALRARYLVALLRTSLGNGSRESLERFRYRLKQSGEDTDLGDRLDRTAHAASAAFEGDHARAFRLLPSVHEAASNLERRCILSVRMFAARSLPGAEQAQEIEKTRDLVRDGDDAERDIVTSASAWLAYGRGDYAEAARLHAQAAAKSVTHLDRIVRRLNAGSAWLEAGAFDLAEELAREGMLLATVARHAMHEMRAEWIVRATRYRRGDDLQPDEELVEATLHVGSPNYGAMICLNEAAIARRAGRRDLAKSLADQAAQIWTQVGRAEPAALARTLALACGAPPHADEEAEAVERVRRAHDGVLAAQMAALLAEAFPAQREALLAAARPRIQDLLPEELDVCHEIMSLADAMQ